MKIELEVNLPYSSGELLVKDYLKVFKEDELYNAFTLDENLDIVKGFGTIENDGSWNHHNNYDDSENVLMFVKENIHQNHRSQRFWTVSEQEIKTLQRENVENNIRQLQSKIDELRSKL